jgi:hypothetical protein
MKEFVKSYLYFQQEVLGRANSPTFPTYKLFEVLEPNLMELVNLI